jgi:hypothetical protein
MQDRRRLGKGQDTSMNTADLGQSGLRSFSSSVVDPKGFFRSRPHNFLRSNSDTDPKTNILSRNFSN